MTEIPLVDTHCHVDFPHFADDRDEVLARFRQAGGRWLLDVAVDLENLPRLFSLADAVDMVYCSVGVHPNHEVKAEPTMDEICSLASREKCVAIGETGLDFFRHRVDPALQEERFRTHIRAAKKLEKPVIVHMRDADDATLRVMREENIGSCGGVMHCFSSTWTVAKQALDMGLYISFTGNITFKNNDQLRDVAKQVPEDMLLIETDSPYLAPVPHRGQRCEPSYVRQVAECIAEARGVSLAKLAEVTTANACRSFRINV